MNSGNVDACVIVCFGEDGVYGRVFGDVEERVPFPLSNFIVGIHNKQ